MRSDEQMPSTRMSMSNSSRSSCSRPPHHTTLCLCCLDLFTSTFDESTAHRMLLVDLGEQRAAEKPRSTRAIASRSMARSGLTL